MAHPCTTKARGPASSRRATLAGLAAVTTGRIARAQDVPIRLIVPFAAGGGGDILARTAAQAAERRLNVPIVIDNRPGAGGNIGAELVARARPDGATLLYGTNGTHGINPALYARLPFDPARDLTPVAALTRIVLLLVVTNDLPVATLPALLPWLRAHPGAVAFASAGNGTTSHIVGEMFRVAASVQVTHVPYRGNGPAMADLIAGRVQMAIDVMPVALPHAQSGRLRALAVAAAHPVAAAPGLPPLTTILPGFEASAWDGIWAPAGTPPATVARLNTAFRDGLRDPEVIARLNARGADLAEPDSPEEFAAFIAAEQPKWAAAVRASGATVD